MESKIIEPIAVIDVGAHSIRMEIVQSTPKGETLILENLAHPVFLGSDVFTKGKISSSNIRHASKVLSDFKQLMREYGVRKYKAIATSAVREASNQDIFINQIKTVSDIDLTILEPSQEIKLLYLAVKDAISKRFGFKNHKIIICSVGTGSTQLAFVEYGDLKSFQTLRFGTIRLIEEISNNVSARKIQDAIEPFVANVVESVARMGPNKKSDLFVIVGATVRSLVSIDRSNQPKQIATLSYDAFKKTFAKIAGVPAAELVERHNIPDSIAMGLEPCCHLLSHFYEITEADKITIPIINTRDVLLHDFQRELAGIPDTFNKEVFSAAKFIGEKYCYDAKHAETVMNLSLSLFDKLQSLHKIGKKERLLLGVAAILHDIGQFVSNRQHHKHVYYIIKNTPIPGLSQEDQHLIATLTRYHRKATPRTSHEEYLCLTHDKRVLVCKLAAILRIADALDRSHQGDANIRRIHLDDEKIEIDIQAPHDMTIERWGLKNKSDLFSDTFGLKVQLKG